MYDLIIIGGGPAGSAAAITAARCGSKVLLLERGHFPRHKVCGEFVSAESRVLLSSLLNDTNLPARTLSISSARIFLGGKVFHAPISPSAASITRFELDYALWEAAARTGVDGKMGLAVHEVSGNGPFSISTPAGDFQSRALINASGRWSNLRLHSEQTINHSRGIGLKAHFATPDAIRTVDLYFFKGGYCGVQPVSSASGDQATINVCAMVRAERATTLGQVFALNPQLYESSRDWRQCTPVVTTSPLIFQTPTPLRALVPQVGDAAAFVDPFIGDGISLALQGGAMAAEALTTYLRNDESLAAACNLYRERYQRELAPVYRNSSLLRRAVNLPGVIRSALAGLMSHRKVAEYIVRKSRRTA